MERDSGSIGIGAMIVFIALILVAAVASTIIIKTVENLSSETNGLLDDRRDSKISIEGIEIFLYEPCWQSTVIDEGLCPGSPWGHHELIMMFTVDGEVSLPDSEVHYLIACPETRTVMTPIRSESFSGSSTWDSRTSTVEGYNGRPFNLGFTVTLDGFLDADSRVEVLKPGESYAIMIDMYDNKNNFGNENEGCRISTDYDVELTIYVEGGMETFGYINCPALGKGTECY